MATGAAAQGSGSASTAYVGKAHGNVPEFSGKSSDYKEYRKRLLLYEKKMSLAGRSSETSFNVLVTLKGRAWDACDDISMSDLEGSTAMQKILERLDKVFKFDAVTELPGDFEALFCTLHRKKNSTLQEYAGDFERALRKLEAHDVTLPDKVVGWYFMRRAGLTQQQRQLIMSALGTETLSLDTVRKAMNFVIGQDSTPEGHSTYSTKASSRWRAPYKEAVYYGEEDESFDFEYGEDADEDPDCFWADDGGDDGEEEDGDDEIHAVNDDLAAEYDEVLAGYTEARQRLNQMRMSRGYYPVVAMIPEQASSSGKGSFSSPKGKSKSKGKGKSHAGKGGKQNP